MAQKHAASARHLRQRIGFAAGVSPGDDERLAGHHCSLCQADARQAKLYGAYSIVGRWSAILSMVSSP
jgi:hypothetical protein